MIYSTVQRRASVEQQESPSHSTHSHIQPATLTSYGTSAAPQPATVTSYLTLFTLIPLQQALGSKNKG